MDGISAIDNIRRINPVVKIFMMTGFSSDKRLIDTDSLGIIKVFQKPFDIEEMLSAINEELKNT